MSQLATVESRFTGLTALLRNRYLKDVIDLRTRVGTPTMQRLKPAAMHTTARDNWLQYEVAAADSARMNTNLLRDYGTPNKSKAGSLNYRYDPDNPALNDVVGIDSVARVSLADMEKAGTPDGMMSLAQKVTKDVFAGINETPSTMMHSDAGASIGAVNGTKVKPTTDFANGDTYVSGDTSATIAIDGYSIGVYRRGMVLDLYNGETMVLDNIYVRHVDYDQHTIVVERTSDTTALNLDGIVDNLTIYRSGEKGQGFKTSFGGVFPETVTAGESWVGGVDRSTIDYMHLLPMMLRRNNATPELPSQSHLDALGLAMGYAKAGTKENPYTLFAGNGLIQSMRNSIGDMNVVMASNTNNKDNQFGNASLRYHHPDLGEIEMVSDVTARNDRFTFLKTQNVKMMQAGFKGLHIATEGNGLGYFERLEGTNGVRGGSKFYKMEASLWETPVWERFDECATVFGLTTDS